MAAAAISVSFPCGLRGYHVYRNIWHPEQDEVLRTIHEYDNPHDRYAIAAKKRIGGLESTVGHLPKEISRLTRFIMLYEAMVTVKVTSVQQRRSPLVQGGLEIPVLVTVQMAFDDKNKDVLTKYDKIVYETYKEPIDGRFEDATAAILKDIYDSEEEDDEDDY